MTTPAAAKKARFGGRVYPVADPETGEIVDLGSASELTRVLAAPGLEIWKQKMIAEQFAARPDLVLLAANPDTRWDAIRQATDVRTAANVGTAIHALTEQVDDGTLMDELVPAGARGYIEHYRRAVSELGIETVLKEQTLYNFKYRYAGTTDRVVRCPAFGDGCMIADIKTGKDVWPDQAIQLALYAYSEGMWIAPEGGFDALPGKVAADAQIRAIEARGTFDDGKKVTKIGLKRLREAAEEAAWVEYAAAGKHLPLPEDLRTDIALIIHLGVDYCEVVPLDISDQEPIIAGLSAINRWKGRNDVVLPVAWSSKNAGEVKAPAVPVAEVAAPPQPPTPEAVAAAPAPAATSPAPTVEATSPAAGDAAGSFLPERPFVSPADQPPPRVRYESYRDRVKALAANPEAVGHLKFQWPDGVPTLKEFVHNTAQLDRIDKLLWETECKFAPAAPKAVAEPFLTEHDKEQGVIYADTSADVAKLQAAFPGSTVVEGF
jgi:hypothetical protein